MMMTPEVGIAKARRAPIEMESAEFRAAGHHLIDQIADWLKAMRDGPVGGDRTVSAVRDALGADSPLPTGGTLNRLVRAVPGDRASLRRLLDAANCNLVPWKRKFSRLNVRSVSKVKRAWHGSDVPEPRW